MTEVSRLSTPASIGPLNACTIVARNYVPHARVLAESFRTHHPWGRFTSLVLDDPDARANYGGESFVALGPYDIGIDRRELHRMAAIYDVKELATAVKPWLLRHLLESADAAVYFDPDIQLFAPLDDVAALAREHAIVLTPHTTEPLPRDGRLPDERMILQAGIYNLGFIAVGKDATTFLEWWAERLRRECVVDPVRGLFVDQRWIDFVPALFDHFVLRDPGCNVAYWNLYSRRVRRSGDGYEVDGGPLRFFHFSGYDPRLPTVLSTHMGDRARLLVSDDPVIEELCREYRRLLLAHGFDEASAEYGFARLCEGRSIGAWARRLYRDALLLAEENGTEEPPNPFDSPDEFVEWLHAPTAEVGLPRLLAEVWAQRADLRAAFPDVRRRDRNRFLAWALVAEEVEGLSQDLVPALEGEGRRAAEVELELRRALRRHPRLAVLLPLWRAVATARLRGRRTASNDALQPSAPLRLHVPRRPEPGINVVGYFRAELGVGEAARRLTLGIESAGIRHTTIPYGRTVSRQAHVLELPERNRAPYDVNLLCVNADQLPLFVRDAGGAIFNGRYSIGVWFWEASRFPEEYHGAFELVDEVWVASDFVAKSIEAETEKPVRVVPLPVTEPAKPWLTRASLGLSDDYLFLFTFDFLSVFKRKNPLGVVDAFCRAFEPRERTRLIVKSINGHLYPRELRRLRRAAAGRGDIDVVDRYVSAQERDALAALCDCYVSLHRSEGFGLTMAEAMAFAKPVIATGYSGNTTFMNAENSLLVPYELVPVGDDAAPYPADALWADPDVDAAARMMRDVYERRDEARELGQRARRDILERLAPETCGVFIAERLEAVRSRSSRRAAVAR